MWVMIDIPPSRRSKGLARGLLAAWLFTSALPAKEWDRKGAESALDEARRMYSALKEDPTSSASPEEYLQCIQLYQQVYWLDPHFGGSDDAVFESARLYQEMSETFENPEYTKRALKLFRFLVSDYRASPHRPEAEQSISRLTQTSNSSRPNRAAETQVAAQNDAGSRTAVEQRDPGSDVIAIVRSIRHWSTSEYTRITIDLDVETRYQRFMLTNPARLYFDIHGSKLSPGLGSKPYLVNDEHVKQIRISQNRAAVVRVVLDLTNMKDYSVSELHDPFRITIDIRGQQSDDRASKESHPRESQGLVEGGETLPPVSTRPAKPGGVGTQPDRGSQAMPAVVRQQLPIAEPKDTHSQVRLVRDRLSLDARDEIDQAGTAGSMASKSQIPRTPSVSPQGDSASGAAPPESTAPAMRRTSSSVTQKRATDKSPAVALDPVPRAKAAELTSQGDRTLTRVLGLKIGRIVLDPGHGGHDTGSIGRNGLKEKDLVLEVARQLQTLLEERLNAEVVLTRTDDTFIPLEERTALANQHQADVFVSIHANSSKSRSVSGVETYYLNFATSLDAQEVAARENVSTARNIRELPDLVKSITRADKSAESRELANILQKRLYRSAQRLFPETRNRGVRTAPFVVLIGADMPSVLAEVGFVSNPRDEKLLKRMDNRKRLAEALYAGIEGYMKSLGSMVAQASNRAKGSAP
jgi:N-acetylmuramoyl-L-alanine amidase